MDDIQIVYNAYSQVFEDPLGFEEFSSSLKSDGAFANDILESVVGFDDDTRKAVNRLLKGGTGGTVQGGITYEEKEVVEDPKAPGFVPEMTDEQYASLPLMDVRRVEWQEWKDSQVEKDPLTSVQDVNQALADPIAAPSYDNQIATIVNYDEYKRGNFLPETNYLGEVLAPGTDPQIEIDKRKAAESQEKPEEVSYTEYTGGFGFVQKSRKETVQEFQDRLKKENVFDVGFFTPYTGSGDDVGAEGFRQAFENSLPEGFKIWTPDNSFMDGKFTMEMLDAMEKSGTKIPDEVKKQKQKGAKQFVIIQDPRGNVHEVKSLFDPGTYDQSPKAAQKAFIKFLGASLDDTVLQQIENTTVEQEDKVAALFNDAFDFSFAPGTTDEQKRNIINSVNSGGNKGGALGLSAEDRIKIQEEVNSISFAPESRTISAGGMSMGGAAGSSSTVIVQPHEKELKEALQQLNISDVTNGVEREEPLTINSKEVQDLTRENIKLKIENDTKNKKYESYIQGNSKVETDLDASLIRIYKDKSKLKAINKAEKANYLTQIAHRSLNNFIANGTDDLKEYNNFINDETIVYNIKPGESVYKIPYKDKLQYAGGMFGIKKTPTPGFRLVPAALVDNAQKEKSIIGSKIQFAKEQQNNFFNQVAKMNNEIEQWDVIKRNYNDGAKFFAQLSMHTADLLLNVGYGANYLINATNPTMWLLNGLGLGANDIIDNSMMAWQNYKGEVGDEYKKDQEFGEIDTWADVGEYALQSVASQTPIILAMIATGGLSTAAGEAAGLTTAQLTRLSTVSSSSLVGLSAFGGKVSDMKYDEFVTGRNLYSDAEILIKGLMYGVVEGGLAAVSTAPLLTKGIGKIKGFNATRAALDEAEEMGRRQFLANLITKEILPETLTEMGAEGLTTGLQNLIDGRPFLENMTETLFTAGIWGAGMSGSVGLVSFGQRSFASNKELKIIKKANRDISEYSMKINNLINQKLEGKLAPDIDINKEISKLIKLKDQATNIIIEAQNQVKTNLIDKGISEPQYVKGYQQGLSDMADIRIEAESVANDKTLSTDEKNKQLDALDKKYRATEFYRDIFTDTKTFGDGFAAMAMKAQRSAPFSKARLEYNKAKAEAIVNIRKEKGQNYDPTRKEIAEAGSKVIKKREIKEQVKKDKTWSNKNGIKYEAFETAVEANTYINDQYDKLIEKEQKAGNDSEVKKLRQEKQQLMNKVSSKETLLSGFNDPRIGAVAIVDNMVATGLTKTGVHEITHGLTDKLIAENSAGFNLMADQIVQYLEYTKQGEILMKMQADNANLTRLYKDANGEVIGSLTDKGYNASELVSSFMENLDKIDLTKMDNQIAVLGRLLNVGLEAATDGSYNIKFSGQEEILNYFKGLGDAIKSKKSDLSIAASQTQTSFSQTDSKLFTEVDKIFASDESLKNKGLQIGNLYRNFVTTRLNKGFEVGKLKIKPRDFSGFNDTILEDVVSDMATGGSGIPGLVKAYANRNMAKFGDIELAQWINARLNQRILGYLPNDLVRNDMSIDSETARQIEDIKASKFDVDVTSAHRGVVPESEAREIKPVEDLEIITPELVDEVKDIITRTLKRTALTKGVSTDSVLSDLEGAIEKEITKVIKSKMGPITRSVLGFAPKQYVDFIKDEMMTIVGSMPTNLIKQKAKSKAWAEVFKLTEIGKEDIKKVNPDTGKVTNYRKQIFKLEKPDPQKFQRYFTRGGYTTLIERQRSLIKPMAQQLTRSELARLRQDKSFIQDLADRTGMTDFQVTELFVDNVIKDIESDLDNTSSEILQQDTVRFSETLAAEGKKNPQVKQTLIDGLSSDGFKAMLEANFVNGSAFPIRNAITQYFYEANIDLDKNKIKKIATELSTMDGMQRQSKAAIKKFDAAQVADIVAITMARNVIFPPNFKALELSMGYEKVNYDFKSRISVNQGRNLALKLYLAVGPERFMKFFKLGFSGPTGLGGLIVEGVPAGINITESEFKRSLPTGKIGGSIDFETDSKGNPIGPITYKNSDPTGFVDMIDLLAYKGYKFDIIDTPPNGSLVIEQKNKKITSDVSELNKFIREGATVRSSLFLNVPDIEQNVFNNPEALKKYPNWKKSPAIKKDAYSKDWFMDDKFQKLSDENKLKKAKEVSGLTKESNENLRGAVEELAEMRRQNELTPEEARFFVAIGGKTMASYIKSAAVFLGYPTLDNATVLEMLNLPANDQFVLEHMTPAMKMSLVIYKYLLDPSPANKKEFNKELDNYNTIMLPFGLDVMLREAGLQSSMGLNYKTGDSQWDTRYSELIKLLEFTLVDGTKVGQNSSKFSKMNNNPKTKQANVDLVDKSQVVKASETNNNGITVIETEVLDKALSIARDPDAPVKKIRVFDFDDTLAESNSLVFYTMPDGTKGELTAEQFAERGSDLLIEGADFNFDDFNVIKDGKPGPLLDVAKAIQNARGTEDVFVLTARAPESAQPIQSFLKSVGLEIPIENITGLGNSSDIAKSSWIVNKAAEGYNDFYFADDAPQNVKAVKNALDLMDVKSKTQLVKENTIKFSETGGKKLDWKTDEAGNINTTFNVGNKKYNFSLDSRDSKGSFDVDFNLGGRRDLTGTGNSVTVIKTVYNGLLNAIDQNKNIKRIEFSADQAEPSRVKLYTTLANRISKKLGWELDVYETKSFVGGVNSFDFELTKPSPIFRALDVVDIKSPVQQAKVRFSETVDQKMNDIIYKKTGIESFKEYSDVRARSEGRGKRSFDLIPPSAEDFGGLLYNLLGKGKEGDAQWEWMQDNLIKPYNRGINDLTVAQNTLAADFKALKNSLEGIPNNLKQKAFGGFTFEDIVRINAWTKQGINVEGLSKRDLKQVNEFVKENPEIDIFSNQLIAINKSDGYYYPGENWIAGTITTDMREGLRTVGRSKYLAQWNANIDEAFSNKNLNKLEAAFGSKYREALEDSIRRMKTGTNRGVAMGRIESRFLDYINNSIGGVMFLNARSAVLQTISSLNFIELTGDNNLFKAGKAFANQPQYWKDFMTLMNSDYLVDRRNGLKINVSESEIAEAAKTSANKAKAVVATLLKKGFVLTQIADSFAIASGGASYYRNKVNAYLKQGLSKADAEARAFEDFKAKSEESQQSSDPSKISQQQASTAGKVILAFANTPSQYSRIMKKAGLDLVNGRGDWKDNVSKIVYYGALQNIIFTTLQSALFAVAFNDDDEEQEAFLEKYKGAKTVNSMTDNILRGLGVGGAVVSTIKNIMIDIYDRSQKTRPEYADVALKLLDVSPPIDIKVSKFRQGMNTWEYGRKDPEAKDPFDINNPAYEAAAKVIASTTNVPLDRLYQKVENIKGALDDDNENWKRVAMALGWPEWQLMSEKQKEEDKKERALKRKETKTRQYAYKPVLDEQGYKEQELKQTTEKYFKLTKPQQVKKLDSLGLSKTEIRSLKYEKDRVSKLLELMEK